MTTQISLRRAVMLALLTVVAAGLASLNACQGPLRVDPLRYATREPSVDEHLAVAREYAPWVLHAADAGRVRDDIPAAFDFDGDLDGGNNWDNLTRYVIEPTLGYSVVGTETHWFLTYHLFHPRDWSDIDLGLHMTHEGDGENLQVVVRREDGRVVLLYTQAHYVGEAYVREGFEASAAEVEPRGTLRLVDDDGHPDPDGAHVLVYVQSGGHGIYGVPDSCADVVLDDAGGVRFDGAGLLLRPARPDEPIAEPDAAFTRIDPADAWPYRLESVPAQLWPGLRDGSLIGEDRLLDGTVPYRDARRSLDVPRYHEGDRFSGPFGPDRGISPFAVDFEFDAPHLGALLFDPARRWSEALLLPEPWSTDYVVDPFTDA